MAMQIHPVPAAASDVDRLIFQTDLVAVGTFRCRRDHPLFVDSGPIRNHCFVFPRTAVAIRHADRPAFQADPTVVTLYNAGAEYRRAAISPEGDHCDYFAVMPAALHGIAGGSDERRLFEAPAAPSPAALYLRQRLLLRAVQAGAPADPLEIEETVIVMLEQILESIGDGRFGRGLAAPAGRRRSLIDDACAVLATAMSETLTLSDLARRVGCSPFHLCRVFREWRGGTLHQYRHQLRLRTALTLIEQGRDLTSVALDVGFSSHSHFTAAFRRAFRLTPTSFRRQASRDPDPTGAAHSADRLH